MDKRKGGFRCVIPTKSDSITVMVLGDPGWFHLITNLLPRKPTILVLLAGVGKSTFIRRSLGFTPAPPSVYDVLEVRRADAGVAQNSRLLAGFNTKLVDTEGTALFQNNGALHKKLSDVSAGGCFSVYVASRVVS